MPTVAENLASIQASKQSLVTNLVNSGHNVIINNSLQSLVDKTIPNEFSPYWAQYLPAWTPTDGISMICADIGYSKLSFTVTCTGGEYTVVVNDGTNDISTQTYSSGAQCDLTFIKGQGKPSDKGYTTYAIKITASVSITRWIIVKSTIAGSVQLTGLLYWYGKITTLNTAANMFYFGTTCTCPLLQGIYIQSTASIVSMQGMFGGLVSLKSLPVFDYSSATILTDFTKGCVALNLNLDLSSGTHITKFTANGIQFIQTLLVSPSAPWSGTSPHIDLTDCGLNRTALVALFNSLGTVTSKTIKITGCVGTADLSAEDLLIATNKGWTVTTV
jgi:hypothetical protein